MNIPQLLSEELSKESKSTQLLLALVPADRLSWKPHDKNMTLGDLASHVAALPALAAKALTTSEYDLKDFPRPSCSTADELVEASQKFTQEAIDALETCSPEQLFDDFTLLAQGNPIVTLPRYWHVRSWTINHVIHHRAQLQVYLRLLDIPIPGMYGPSADQPMK